MKILNNIKLLWAKLLNVLFPEYRCFLCGREVFDVETKICENCKKNFPHIEGHICEKCGAPIPEHNAICDTCKSSNYVFDEARASFLYGKETRKLFYGIKYNNKKYIAKFLAKEMAQTFKNWGIIADIIVPVPLCETRLKMRGYNQSLLIGDELSKLISIPVDEDVVRRVKDTPNQTKLSRNARERNLKGAFKRNTKKKLRNKNILLIDDVFTTGSTVNEVTRELIKFKPAKIYVLTAGKTEFYNAQ